MIATSFLSTALATSTSYLLYNRHAAPRYWELFVGYGKDRVSFSYELAARGFEFVVVPDAWLVHVRSENRAAAPTAPAAAPAAAHAAAPAEHVSSPSDWVVGETCWPDFQQRVRIKYNWLLGWCAARSIDQGVGLDQGDASLAPGGAIRCLAQLENVCVLNCQPRVQRWALQNGSAAAGARVSTLLPDTPPRPPKQGRIFSYALDQRASDVKRCGLGPLGNAPDATLTRGLSGVNTVNR